MLKTYFVAFGYDSLLASAEKSSYLAFTWIRDQLLHQSTPSEELAHDIRGVAMLGIPARLVETEAADE